MGKTTVGIMMYLDNINIIDKKDLDIKYYEVTYRSVDGLYYTMEAMKVSDIKESIFFNVTIDDNDEI